jgi:diguanylate cyclase (GGDEF)-like protein/PAS domain S-box-containing protein
MPHIVWIADQHGQIRYFNQSWYGYTGSEAAANVEAAWQIAAHIDDQAVSAHAWSVSLATGKPFEMQCRLRRADGMYRWHVARAIPIADESGAIIEWVGSYADIHDYKIASETRTILDTIDNIVAIRADDGFIDYASPYWTEYTGTSSGSALGFGWRDFVHPADLHNVDRIRDELCTALDGTREYEVRIRDRRGAYRWFLSRTTTLPGTGEGPRRWLDTAMVIDDLKRTQAALATSETRYRALTDSIPQMVWVAGAAMDIEYVNRRWSEYTGLDLSATQIDGTAAIVHPADLAGLDAMRDATPDAEYVCEARFRRHDGAFRWHAVRAVPFNEPGDATARWLGTATDIEDSKAAAVILANTAAKLEHLAHHDPMTNLPNRMLLVERLGQAIALAQRAKSQILVLYIDLDRFKIINDTRGHAAGDRVLAVTGQRIAEALRTGDTASRVGGDEFVLVCATTEATEDAARLAARLLEAIGQPIEIDGDYVCVGASIGISMYPADGVTGDELISHADSAMYCAKQSGRNLFRMYHDEAHNSIIAALDFESELRSALERREIVVHYQPIMSLRTNDLLGAEALVRWQHPRRGLLHPADFLAFAESHRLSGAIGSAVLDAVCAQIAALSADATDDFHISMNVSVGQLMQPGWVDEIATALTRHGVAPRRLHVEIAERIVMNESPSVMTILGDLNALGVSLSIDDFGTGLCSLASIKNFPLQTIKIDRSFVHDLATDRGDQAMAKTIIMLAHSLGLSVIAAGVETQAQINALREYGSDAFQGYLASHPMAADDLTTFVTAHARTQQTPKQANR